MFPAHYVSSMLLVCREGLGELWCFPFPVVFFNILAEAVVYQECFLVCSVCKVMNVDHYSVCHFTELCNYNLL